MADSIFAPSLSALSRGDREFIEAMSLDNNGSDIATITKRLGTSAASVQQTRRRLIAAGVILAAGIGRVDYALPYLGEYLRGEL
jgi:DNA-binding Lrp family transcriptional regulator